MDRGHLLRPLGSSSEGAESLALDTDRDRLRLRVLGTRRFLEREEPELELEPLDESESDPEDESESELELELEESESEPEVLEGQTTLISVDKEMKSDAPFGLLAWSLLLSFFSLFLFGFQYPIRSASPKFNNQNKTVRARKYGGE